MAKIKKYQSPEVKDITLTTDSVIAPSFKNGGEGLSFDLFKQDNWLK